MLALYAVHTKMDILDDQLSKENRSVAFAAVGNSAADLGSVFGCFPSKSHEEVLSNVLDVWNRIGFPVEEQQKRCMRFFNSLDACITEVLQTGLSLQLEYEKQLLERISQFTADVRTLRDQLDIVNEPLIFSEIGLFEQEELVTKERNHLLEMKHKRQQMLNTLREENISYSKLLGSQIFAFPGQGYYKLSFLDDLSAANLALEEIKHARIQRMSLLKEEIPALADDLEREPIEFDFELLTEENIQNAEIISAELKQAKQENLDDSNCHLERISYLVKRFQLSSEFVENPHLKLSSEKTVALLQNERNRLEEDASAKMEVAVKEIRKELEYFWEKLLYTPTDRAAFTAFTSDEYDEALLRVHEEEFQKVEQKFEANRKIFNLLDSRKNLLKEKLTLEEKEMDPEVMKNRGGILLKMQHEKKDVDRKLEKELRELQAIFQKKIADGEVFLIGGLNLEEYLKKEKSDFDQTKANRAKSKDLNSSSKRKNVKDSPLLKKTKLQSTERVLGERVLGRQVNSRLNFSSNSSLLSNSSQRTPKTPNTMTKP